MIGLAEFPKAMITRSAGTVSVRPVATGRRRPEASGSPSSITSSTAARTKWVASSPRNSLGERSVASCTPSSRACSNSSTRAGISSWVRRYAIVTCPPSRRAVRAASIAVLPPPITITCLPRQTGSGVSWSSRWPCIRFTLVRNSLALITLSRCSPGTFMNRGRPAPEPTKMCANPASFSSARVAVLPTTKLVTNVPPNALILPTTSSINEFGSRNSGMP